MTNRPQLRQTKWIFILADLILLAGFAWTARFVLPPKSTLDYVVLLTIIALWMVGAWICVLPWIQEFKAQLKLAENDTLTSALEQIQKLEDIGKRVQTATASWQSAQDAAARVVASARDVEDKIKADSKDFMEFAERMSNDEKNHLRLEVEKLRRAEAEWLQVAARILDHTFALTQAAHRSGQPNLATQMNNFQNACRDAARRVGLVPFQPNPGEPFDERSQQLEEQDAKPQPGAVVSDILATGFTFQGQLLRRALVRVIAPEGESQPSEPPPQAAAEEPQVEPATESPAAVEESIEDSNPAPAEEPAAEWNQQQPAEQLEEAVAQPEELPSAQQEESIVERAAAEPEADSEMSRPRRQRKADPQTSLPF